MSADAQDGRSQPPRSSSVSAWAALLKRTQSRCPVCRAPLSAEVWRVAGEAGPDRVVLRGVSFAHFTSHDVVRHPLVQRIVQAYERAGGDS